MDIAPPETSKLSELASSLKPAPLKAVKGSVFAVTFLALFGTITILLGKPVFLWLQWLWSHYL